VNNSLAFYALGLNTAVKSFIVIGSLERCNLSPMNSSKSIKMIESKQIKGAATLNITTLSITTFGITINGGTLYNTKHKLMLNLVFMLNLLVLSVVAPNWVLNFNSFWTNVQQNKRSNWKDICLFAKVCQCCRQTEKAWSYKFNKTLSFSLLVC
jgi:hypothetical protein